MKLKINEDASLKELIKARNHVKGLMVIHYGDPKKACEELGIEHKNFQQQLNYFFAHKSGQEIITILYQKQIIPEGLYKVFSLEEEEEEAN